ncbi:vWA domain-containing protein [Ornithinimicrobium cerasi]|uniref:Ca-activated chloride channel family protein n=1 Tax=Ornithinimicrobium cerasi TaxID=2248773 RepID=A0A285VGA6_9MICO|nr:VWA domain-containing protein [Ornithinimicrobium cerasi]SOC52156.1 Ca-activated chloride channel family protein [Ornithinimicrobium cerasi]
MLLRLTRSVALATALLLAPHAAVGAPIAAQPTDGAGDASMLLLLDASRSMEDPDAEGEPKIDAARAALDELIDGLDPAQSVGLRVFGGSVALDQPAKDKCTDSELVVPIGTDNADALSTAVEDYSPLGETPIAHALHEAAQDLGEVGNRTIVLVSDGIATCDPDPCEVAEQLTADGLDLVVHTVGLGADEQTRGQLQCIAEAGGGKYYDATDAASLTSVLTRVSSRAFRPFTVQGTPVSGTTDATGGPDLTPGGQYTDTFGVPGQPKSYTIRRSVPGTEIWVGASGQPSSGRTAMAELQLETTEGRTCASNRFYAGTDVSGASIMSDSVHIPAAGPGPEEPDDCQSALELRLSITTV